MIHKIQLKLPQTKTFYKNNSKLFIISAKILSKQKCFIKNMEIFPWTLLLSLYKKFNLKITGSYCGTHMATLRNAHSSAKSTLDLSHMDYPSDTHNLQHAVIMCGFVECIFTLWTPWVGSWPPATLYTHICMHTHNHTYTHFYLIMIPKEKSNFQN